MQQDGNRCVLRRARRVCRWKFEAHQVDVLTFPKIMRGSLRIVLVVPGAFLEEFFDFVWRFRRVFAVSSLAAAYGRSGLHWVTLYRTCTWDNGLQVHVIATLYAHIY